MEYHREVQDCIRVLREDLNLCHWRIEVSTTPASPGTHFEIITNRPRNHASIRVNPNGVPDDQIWQLLKHELLHLVLDPIREEHDFQVASLPADRRKEYSERILRQIEKAVEHLSHVV